ncbi:MAG: lipid-A-disaccharide synthase [SAR324 cluster bacterium]|nr:lipid-A-disaccharide synthase [SAR324 cluster bacterium]
MPKLMVIAGEASGDLHGGNVITRLKKQMPDLELFGTGGQLLESAGCKIYYRVEDLAVIGIWEVAKRYGYYKGIFNEMVALLDSEKPDAVFLVDYAGFNLKFAKEAKKRGIKVIFYIAPQVWAWKKNRIKKIKAYVDELIVLFPFEVEWFQAEGMVAHCFGHPLLDIAKPSRPRAEVLESIGLSPAHSTLAILPGSRENEIIKHLPMLVPAIDLIHEKAIDIQFVYPVAPTVNIDRVAEFFKNSKAKVVLDQGHTYDIVAACDLAMVASGTATLETAILETPLLIFYKVTKATNWIGRNILKLGAIGLPNIIAKKTIVPELIQHDFSPESLAKKVLSSFDDPHLLSKMKKDLRKLKEELGETGGYDRTADFVKNSLETL